MKRLVVFVWCCVFLLLLAGCKDTGRVGGSDEETVVDDKQSIVSEEAVVDGGQFPEVMVGAWEAQIDLGKWAFTFEHDGSISKIIHPLAGRVDLNEEGIYLEGPEPGTYATFVMGPCEAEYSEDTRELKVKIILDDYQIVLSQEQLEGSAYDFFLGSVSEDGEVWTALWKHLSWLEGADSPEPNSPSVQLTFTKVDDE